MARNSSPWHALRPVLLAGAAAVTWLTLSSTAATADTGSDSSSLLSGVTSSVSSLTQDLPATVSPVPAGSAGGPATDPGLLQPAVAPVAGLADNLIAAVPGVDQVVPAGTVSAVSAPVAELADTATAGVAQVVVAPAAGAIPVLEPVLQPVSDLMTGAAPLPVPSLEDLHADVPAVLAPAPAEDQAAALQETPEAVEMAPDATGMATGSGQARGNAVLETAGAGILANSAGQPNVLSVTTDFLSEQPLPADPSPLPAQAPAAPASGTGSGGTSGGTPAAAAWLNPTYFDFEVAGAVRADRFPGHVPSPVSFDPGSSPD